MSEYLVLPTEQETVVLTQLTAEDATAFSEAVVANREHLWKFGRGTLNCYATPSVAERTITDTEKLLMAIRDGDKIVGGIYLTPDYDKTSAEIGYWLDGRQTGKGYATVAARALAAYAKERYPIVEAVVKEENDDSIRVLARSGFKFTKQIGGRLFFEF